MAQRISALTKVTEITETDELVITDFNDANSTKGVDISVLFDAVNRLKNEGTGSGEPDHIKVWTGTRGQFNTDTATNTTTTDGVLYFISDGSIIQGTGTAGTDIVDSTKIQAYDDGATLNSASTTTSYTIRVVDNGQVPAAGSRDANTIYFERS